VGLMLARGGADGALSVWPGRAAVGGDVERPGALGVMAAAQAAAQALAPATSPVWTETPDGARRLALPELRRLAEEWGVASAPEIGPRIESASADFSRGFLRGLFDAMAVVEA